MSVSRVSRLLIWEANKKSLAYFDNVDNDGDTFKAIHRLNKYSFLFNMNNNIESLIGILI
jgi:hypothetical protein